MVRNKLARKCITAKEARRIAIRHLLFNYPTMVTGTIPHRLELPSAELWIVPMVWTHPDHGIVGEVGSVAVDALTGEVVGTTSRREVVAAGKRLREAKGYALETTVLRPVKV